MKALFLIIGLSGGIRLRDDDSDQLMMYGDLIANNNMQEEVQNLKNAKKEDEQHQALAQLVDGSQVESESLQEEKLPERSPVQNTDVQSSFEGAMIEMGISTDSNTSEVNDDSDLSIADQAS